jgi:PAS domain S-box-containing protein
MKSSTSVEIDIPSDVLEKWQEIVDLLAEIIHVPSALVMKVEPPNIKVLLSSKSEGNPYERDEVACLDTGLYCETVMKTRRLLVVPDALHEEAWKSNPDTKLGMISYMGFPVSWPDGQVFGTICVLDNKNNEYNELYRRFLLQCRDVLQADLRAIAKLGAELATQKAHLDELFTRVPEAIVLVDHLDRVLRVNPEFESIFGYREDEALGLPLTSLIVPEELRREAEDHCHRVLHNGEILTLETVRKHKNGRRVPVSMACVPVALADRSSSVYGIYRDITARRQLEDDLKHERDRLRLLLNITNSITSRLDLGQLIEALSTDLLSVMRCDHCALLLPDPDSGQLRVTVLYNPEGRGSVKNGMIVPIHGSMSGKVFRTGKSVRIDRFEQILQDPEIVGHPEASHFWKRVMAEGLKSGCYFPLFSRAGILGVLTACRRSENAFTEDDGAFLEQVAQQVAIAVENALDYGRATEDRDKEPSKSAICKKKYEVNTTSGRSSAQVGS